MKSIKEKSNEYAREFVEPFVLYYTKDEVRQFEAQHEDSFEAGANYVLEQLEDILSHPRRFVNADTSIGEAMIAKITKIVEQLNEK